MLQNCGRGGKDSTLRRYARFHQARVRIRTANASITPRCTHPADASKNINELKHAEPTTNAKTYSSWRKNRRESESSSSLPSDQHTLTVSTQPKAMTTTAGMLEGCTFRRG